MAEKAYTMENSTDELSIWAAKCEDLAEFKNELMPKLKSYRSIWETMIRDLFKNSGKTQAKFASLCGVSQTMVSKWLTQGAVPRSRETFIRIALAAGLDLDSTNELLRKTGYPELYARSIEDSVFIFVLSNDKLPHTFESCSSIRKRIMDCIQTGCSSEPDRSDPIRTDMLQRFMMDAESEAQVMQLIKKNLPAYQKCFSALYRFILEALNENISGAHDVIADSVNALSDLQGWSSSLKKCVYNIIKQRWFPTRTKLISLGLHLNMNVNSLNEMLRLAYMSPLYAKNPVECALLFAIENADLNDAIIKDGRRDLCDYTRKVLKKLDLLDAKALIDELECRY